MRRLAAALLLAAAPAGAADLPWRMASGVPCNAVVQAVLSNGDASVVLRVHNPTSRAMQFLTLMPDVSYTDGRTGQAYRQSPRYAQHQLAAGATGDLFYYYFNPMPVITMVEVTPVACM